MLNPLSLFRGAAFFLEGLRLISHPKIRPYVYAPLLINVLVFVGLIALLAGVFGDLISWLMPVLPEWLQWLDWILWLFFAFSSVIIIFFSFSMVANIIAAPFSALLAEAVEKHVQGKPQDYAGLSSFFASLLPTMWDEIKRLRYTLLWTLLALLLFIIPVVNLLAPLVWLVVSSWLLGFEYTSFNMCNRQIKLPEQLQLLRKQRLLTIGFGGITLLVTMIPLLNLLVIPVAVTGGTLLSLKIREQ